MARIADAVCFQTMSDPAKRPALGDVAGDEALIGAAGLKYGLDKATFDRLGPMGSGLVSRAAMGNVALGDDAIVLSYGGQLPGCNVSLLSKDGISREYEIVNALVASGWKEPRPGLAEQRGFIGKRLLARRDDAGNPYMINVLTVMKPGEQLRHIVMTVPVPPHVKMPAGF